MPDQSPSLVLHNAAASLAPSAAQSTIFISYSRADGEFADELVAALEAFCGFDVKIDREDIHEGEEWRRRLSALIASSDTVVFVLSQKSARSQVCGWEIEEALRLSKRVLPVLASPLGDAAVPKALADLHYIRFDPLDTGRPRSFVGSVVALRRALNTDIGWIREHTRLLLRAQEWQAAAHAESRLLAGADIAQAKAWLDRPPREAPAPTELHREFIAASDRAQELRLSAERANATRLARANAMLRWAFGVAALLAVGMGYSFHYARQKSLELSRLEARNATERYNQSQQTEPPGVPTSVARRNQFSSEPRIERLKDGTLKALQSFTFFDSASREWTVPAGFISGSASIPRPFWSIINPVDAKLEWASMLHDYYASSRERSWEDTHKMFLEALLASGVEQKLAQTLYAGLLIGGPRWPAPATK